MNYARAVQPEPYWLVVAGLVIADQILKSLVGSLNRPIEIASVSIGKVINPAGVFGLDLPSSVLVAAGAVICIGLLALLASGIKRAPARLGLWLLFGGALSNTVDRMFHGGVVDIIAVAGLSRFNLADVMIVLGALSLLRAIWWKEPGEGSVHG